MSRRAGGHGDLNEGVFRRFMAAVADPDHGLITRAKKDGIPGGHRLVDIGQDGRQHGGQLLTDRNALVREVRPEDVIGGLGDFAIIVR